MQIHFKLTDEAKALKESLGIDFTPMTGTALSCGHDLRACLADKLTIYPDEVVKIPTGVCFDLVAGSNNLDYDDILLGAVLLPRSSFDHRLRVTNSIGLIDTDYQGQVLIKVKNASEEVVIVDPGARLAQIAFTLFIAVENFIEFEEFDGETTRGEGGFGSTGEGSDG